MKFNARVGLEFIRVVHRGIESNLIKHLFRSYEALNQNRGCDLGSISNSAVTFRLRCPYNGVHIYAGVFSPRFNIF